jgi:hypothetical protein
MKKTEPTLAQVQTRMRQGPMVFKTHTHANIADFFQGSSSLSSFIAELFERSKIIYVHRDGRDVMVSLYYYMTPRNRRAPEPDFHDFLRMRNDIDAVTYRADFDRPSYWAFHVESWLAMKNVLPVSFEDVLTNHRKVLSDISDFTQQSLASEIRNMRRSRRGLGFLAEQWRRRVRLGLLGEKKFTSVSFRKGESGDWVNHFSKEDVEFFEQRAGVANRRLKHY